MTCKVRWNNGNNTWQCTRQLNNYPFSKHLKECFYIGCPGRSEPPPPTTVVVTPTVNQKTTSLKNPSTVAICSYIHCNKPQAPNRKYCSDVCRKRYARWAYKQRKKLLSKTTGGQAR